MWKLIQELAFLWSAFGVTFCFGAQICYWLFAKPVAEDVSQKIDGGYRWG